MIKPDFVAGIIGNVITILLCTSPAGAFWAMAKKSAGEHNAFPYMCQLLCRTLWVFYGILSPVGLLIITVNSVGVYTQIIYVLIYLTFAHCDKKITVIRMKSVQYMPFLLSFFLPLNAGAWFAFAMFLQDPYLIVPNVVGLVSGSAQLIIYIIYKNKPSPVY